MFAGPPQSGPQTARHKGQPDEQAGQQEQLPEAAQIDVFITLMAEPEPGVTVQFLLHAQPLAGQGTNDDDQEGGEEDVDEEALPLRFTSADGRSDEQAGGQPGGGDPEDAQLRVPGAHDGVGQNLVQRNAVETGAFDAVVCGDGSQADL